MGTGRKLLLADDSITIQKVVNLTFVDEGMEVTTVGNGDLAIEKIEELNPDIVLADIHMPGPNGYEVCEFVKRNERFRHIPVMLLVGSFEPFDEAEARRVGADDHLTKPFQSIRNLVNRVGALLSGTSSRDETPTKELDASRDVQVDVSEQSETSPQLASSDLIGTETLEPGAATSDDGEDAFADPSLDDAMIETMPVGDFNLDRTIGTSRATTPLNLPNTEQSESGRVSPSTINTQDTLRLQVSDVMKEQSHVSDTNPYQSAGSARVGMSDDMLLDLGDDEPQLSRSERNESILDIWDESPVDAVAQSSALAESPITQYDGDVTELAEPAASHIDAERVEGTPVVEVMPEQHEGSETVSVDPVVDADTVAGHSGLITLEQLSPEVIDAIARRAVEQLSEKVVEQIAWEVVPELAERLIKRRLEQEGKP